MRRWYGTGRTLLGATTLCLAIFGCAAQHDDTSALNAELIRARADAAAQQTRAADLEARLTRLEQQTATARSAQDRQVLNHLDRLLDMNERLLSARETPPTSDAQRTAQATPQPQTKAPKPSAAQSSPSTETQEADEEQQLRALVERMRGRQGSLRGGLTVEQENALRVLLRSERKLDSENPIIPAFY